MIVPTVSLEELQGGARLRALLQFVKDKAGLSGNKRGTRNHGGEIHHNVIHFLGATESGLGFLHLIEVNIDVVRIVLLGKTQHGESLPTLTDTFDDEGLP